MTTVLPAIDLGTGSGFDLDLVASIMADAFDPRFGEAWTRSQVVGILALPGVWLTLARIDDAGVGFALTRAVAGEAELLLLAVRPAHRRRGVGGALLRAVEADCRGRGVVRLVLEVRSNNDAIRLYGQAGFAKVGVRRSYYGGADGQRFRCPHLRARSRLSGFFCLNR